MTHISSHTRRDFVSGLTAGMGTSGACNCTAPETVATLTPEGDQTLRIGPVLVDIANYHIITRLGITAASGLVIRMREARLWSLTIQRHRFPGAGPLAWPDYSGGCGWRGEEKVLVVPGQRALRIA